MNPTRRQFLATLAASTVLGTLPKLAIAAVDDEWSVEHFDLYSDMAHSPRLYVGKGMLRPGKVRTIPFPATSRFLNLQAGCPDPSLPNSMVLLSLRRETDPVCAWIINANTSLHASPGIERLFRADRLEIKLGSLASAPTFFAAAIAMRP